MISFCKLGNYGRLGNQLFQYAFLRMTARRLGTQFFCPKWDGDDIFNLNDEGERASEPSGLFIISTPTVSLALHPKHFPSETTLKFKGTFNLKNITQTRDLYVSGTRLRTRLSLRLKNSTATFCKGIV